MNQARTALAFSSLALIAACGGKSAPRPAALAIDPCTAGIHATGHTMRGATWDAIAMHLGARADAICESSPCGPDEPISFAGAAPDDMIAVKVRDGWLGIPDVWDADEGVPQAKLTPLGDLVWLSLDFMQEGRDEVTLDDGTETTATVMVGRTFVDYVLDPATGKALWRGTCGGEGDAWRPTVVTRAGDSFDYVPCSGPELAIRFTAEQAAACPTDVEGPR